MRPQGGRQDRTGGRWRRGTKPGSARSKCATCKDPVTRDRDPLNGCTLLTRVAVKGRMRGGTPHQAACAHGAHPETGGTPNTTASAFSTRLAFRGGRGSPAPVACATCTQAGVREDHLDQAARILRVQPEGGGRGKPPQTALCTHRAWHANKVGGGTTKPGRRGRGTPRAACAPSAWHAGKG